MISRPVDPTVWETIFASPVVVLAARVVVLSAAVVLLFGGLYIAVSILHRMRHGQWLQKAGPFEAHLGKRGEGDLQGEAVLLELYAEALARNEILAAKLAGANQQIEARL